MRNYFIRRLLLIPPTLLGITLIAFFITRMVPGGPVERALAESQMINMQGGSSRGGGDNVALSEEQILQLKKLYGLDKPWYVAYPAWLGNLIQGDLGTSFRYQEPVFSLIAQRMPISVYFGVMSAAIAYLVCIPLGVFKALTHRSLADNATSVVVFAGYAVPGYALGALLVVYLCMRLDIFPKEGWPTEDWFDLGFFARVGDLLHHTFLPLVCYLLGAFAFMTMLMKNQLMENLAADYVRTAVAKGVSFRGAVIRHALRNSLIPIATTLGHLVSVFVAGSFLIEYIFDIDGIGLLGYTSILDRDYPVFLGILVLSAFLMLLGNILSDVCVALVDPRVKFH
ncbi:MAG: ABC transporter permease subunit [Verrucomicrobiales bacterium]